MVYAGLTVVKGVRDLVPFEGSIAIEDDKWRGGIGHPSTALRMTMGAIGMTMGAVGVTKAARGISLARR
jgi:hypothetical protein